MNLAIDIGNTSLKKASFSNSKVSNIKHIDYSKNNFKKLLFSLKKDLDKYDNIYICSVVPELDIVIKKQLSKSKIHFIKKSLLKSYVHKTVNLKQLGIDRLVNVLSVNQIYPKNKNFIIIDLGTATTLDLIINSQYFGGAILPGLKTSYANLISLASGINSISFQELNDVIGKIQREPYCQVLILAINS
jgi:type III pantothenate kinase